MKNPVIRKPNSSPLFIGRKDVLDKLGKIFVHAADSKLMLRRSCLLWGTGLGNRRDWKDSNLSQVHRRNIRQVIATILLLTALWIHLCSRLSHVFWVDASSLESINMSLKGISSIPAAHASCLDGSAESVLQWISGIQEEWLIVFDNADDLPPDVVAKFIPSGKRGNILISS